MDALEFFNKYASLFLVLIAAVIYLVSRWKQGANEASENTIKLLQDEVLALRTRLDTTTTQVTQLTSQVISLNKSIGDLQEENFFLKKLINEALKEYFAADHTSVEQLKEKFKKKEVV